MVPVNPEPGRGQEKKVIVGEDDPIEGVPSVNESKHSSPKIGMFTLEQLALPLQM